MRSEVKMRPIVLTAATGYTPPMLEPFLRSLAEFSPTSTVGLIASRDARRFEEELRDINPNVIIEVVSDDWLRRMIWKQFRGAYTIRRLLTSGVTRFVEGNRNRIESVSSRITALLHISLARYFAALGLLKMKYVDAGQVLLTDSRDVFFQADPFEAVGEEIVTGLEDKVISRCRHNSAWVRQVYGVAGIDRIGHETIICSGVTLGRRDAILNYLETMCSEMLDHFAGATFQLGLDQAIHNWVLRTSGKVKFRGIANGHRFLATLNHSDLTDFRFDETTGLTNLQNEPVAIVHQYDRKKDIEEWCNARWRLGQIT